MACKLNSRHRVCTVQFRLYGLFAFVFPPICFIAEQHDHTKFGVWGAGMSDGGNNLNGSDVNYVVVTSGFSVL